MEIPSTIIVSLMSILGVIVGLLVNVFLERYRSETQLSLKNLEFKESIKRVAVERRLEVHQMSYKLCLELRHLYDDDNMEIYHKARKFWEENSLYLDSASREKLIACIRRFIFLIQMKENKSIKVQEKSLEFFEEMIPNTMKSIVEGIGMPWLDEEKDLKVNK